MRYLKLAECIEEICKPIKMKVNYFNIKSVENGKITNFKIDLNSNITSINALRSLVRAYADLHNVIEINEIEIEIYNGRKLKYGSIQTKRGLAGKPITFEELFERGGKIMY